MELVKLSFKTLVLLFKTLVLLFKTVVLLFKTVVLLFVSLNLVFELLVLKHVRVKRQPRRRLVAVRGLRLDLRLGLLLHRSEGSTATPLLGRRHHTFDFVKPVSIVTDFEYSDFLIRRIDNLNVVLVLEGSPR